MSKIAVFGANGFIGQNLVRVLATNSKDKIIAFDKFTDYQRTASHPFDAYQNVEIVVGDFFNRANVSDALKGVDYVFHLVSATTPATSNDDPFIDIDTNIKSSVELFELCAQNKIKKVIFLSSGGSVYGDLDNGKIDELTVPLPRSPYGIGKLTIEHYLRYFKYTAGLDYIVYRVANPYGRGQNIYGRQGVIPIFMHDILSGKPLTIYGKGDMVRDYVYIDDLIDMIIGSYKKANNHCEYNLGSGKGQSVNDIVAAIEKWSAKKVKKTSLPTPATYVKKNVLDISRFVEEFGIGPQVSLDDGIKKTWDYVRSIS